MNRTLDKLVPPKKPRKQAKPARPWYNTRLLGQRRIVRNRENTYKNTNNSINGKPSLGSEIDTSKCLTLAKEQA